MVWMEADGGGEPDRGTDGGGAQTEADLNPEKPNGPFWQTGLSGLAAAMN
jgi:hypothetical protein